MIVQHNISGMNANRQLNITTGLQAKSAEKLSSGYRINRAADDAAGLSISEKMRRQIRGLTQASENAQDGISFVQIADGALAEVHDMIQRGNELAVKAANDTLTAQDREYINQEVTKLKEEIDAIGGKTTFNEIPIFPANGSSTTEATPGQQALLNRIATEMIPTVVSQMFSYSGTAFLGSILEDLAQSNPDIGAMDLQMSYIDGPSNTLAYMQGGFYPVNGGIDVFASESLLMNVDSADFTSGDLDETTEQMLESTIAHELMHGLMDLTLPEGMCRNDTADESLNFPKWFIEGTAQLVGGGFTTGWNDALLNMSDVTSVSNYLKQYTVENRVYGHGYLACAYLCHLVSGNTTVDTQSIRVGLFGILASLYDNYKDYADGKTTYSFEECIERVFSGTGATSGLTVSKVIANINSGEANAAQFVLDLTNACRNGAGSIIAPAGLNSPDVLGSTVTTQQLMYVKDSSASGSTASEDTILYLQVGSETTSPNEIALKRFAMSASAIGITNANTLTAADSLEAIGLFKGALVNVSSMRSYYGAMQNRLEHTVKNLDNVVENTQAAESRIRDTDMADEMVRFSNNNILAQAGQSMLAQANQTNQGVLSLLQ